MAVLAHTPQCSWVLFEAKNDCIVHEVQRAEHTSMFSMIGDQAIEKTKQKQGEVFNLKHLIGLY